MGANGRSFFMKQWSLCAVVMLAALALSAGCASTGGRTMQTVTEYHVSPTGDDRCSGERDMPFRTLTHARDMIRLMRTAGTLSPSGVTVWLHEGRHELDETFVLGPDDSGTPNAPVVFRALPDAEVTISGGRELTDWSDYTGDDAAVDGIRQTSIAHLGFTESDMVGTYWIFPFELFYRGKRMDQARWPNRIPDDIYSGWAHIASVPDPEQRLQFGVGVDTEKLRGWAKAEYAQFHMYARYDWSDTYVGLGRVDVEGAQIHLADPTNYTIASGRRYMIRNVFSELDTPGEWHVNVRDGVVSFFPPDGLDDGDVIVSRVDELVRIEGASHIVFRDLRFEHARKSGIVVVTGDGNTIAASTITNVGEYAVRIDGGASNRVVGCDISETGTGGVVLSGGDRATLTPANNVVENCNIHHFSVLRKCYLIGVNINGVGNRIAHNVIHHAPHTAILLHGNEHVIEYNEIHNVCEEAQDAGAFYMGRNWTERGNIIRYNSFHDIYGYGFAGGDSDLGYLQYETPRGVWGVYLDDNASGSHVYGNVFYRVPNGAFHIGGGKDNIVENNVIDECYPAVHIDARWEQFFAPDSAGGVNTYMRRHLTEVNYQQPPYSERYPNLVGVLDEQRAPARNRIERNVIRYRRDDTAGFWNMREQPESAIVWQLSNYDTASTVIDNNLIWHYGEPVRVEAQPFYNGKREVLGWDEWRSRGWESGSAIADPKFVAPEDDDYRLAPDSPAFDLGFVDLPWDKIGPYADELRATWPIEHPVTRRPMSQTLTTTKLFDFLEGTVWHWPAEMLVAGPFSLDWDGTWSEGAESGNPTNNPGFTRAYGPENVSLHRHDAVFETLDGSTGWKKARRDDFGYVDFTKIFRTTDNTVSYARVTVIAPGDTDTRISVGSNDGVRVWLNGALIGEENVGRGAKPHQLVIPVRLRAGENTVLVKVSNIGGGWGMLLGFEDPNRQLIFRVDE